MNRVDFMNQLERLLQSIAPGERDEALQYYNDYFDDAGKENEQEVIEALGNPARVAENIKRDLLGSGYGGESVPKAQPSDRAIIEYGKDGAYGEEAAAEESAAQSGFAESAGNAEHMSFAGQAFGGGMSGGAVYGEVAYGQNQTCSYQGGSGAPAKKEGLGRRADCHAAGFWFACGTGSAVRSLCGCSVLVCRDTLRGRGGSGASDSHGGLGDNGNLVLSGRPLGGDGAAGRRFGVRRNRDDLSDADRCFERNRNPCFLEKRGALVRQRAQKECHGIGAFRPEI